MQTTAKGEAMNRQPIPISELDLDDFGYVEKPFDFEAWAKLREATKLTQPANGLVMTAKKLIAARQRKQRSEHE